MSAVQDRSIPTPEDPLGLGALLARLSDPPLPAQLSREQADDHAVVASAGLGFNDDVPAHTDESGFDLSDVADMARQVEDARFAAESLLYAQLQAAADSAAAAASDDDRNADRHVGTEIRQIADLRVEVTPEPAPSLTDWHQELAAVVAASAAELAAAGNPPAAPLDGGAIPVDPPTPAPFPPPIRTLNSGHTDTAALLRELASLGHDDRMATENPPSAPAQRVPPGSRTAPGVNPKNKRKGLFGR